MHKYTSYVKNNKNNDVKDANNIILKIILYL